MEATRQFYGMMSVKFIMELLKVEKTVKQLDIKQQKLEKGKLIHFKLFQNNNIHITYFENSL